MRSKVVVQGIFGHFGSVLQLPNKEATSSKHITNLALALAPNSWVQFPQWCPPQIRYFGLVVHAGSGVGAQATWGGGVTPTSIHMRIPIQYVLLAWFSTPHGVNQTLVPGVGAPTAPQKASRRRAITLTGLGLTIIRFLCVHTPLLYLNRGKIVFWFY